MTDTTSSRSTKNISEVLFEDVLRGAGLADFAYEPQVQGTTRRPDYLARWKNVELLFEVKELRSDSHDMPGFSQFDPYRAVREKIGAARKKFKDINDRCCTLVLYNVDKPLVALDWEHVYGAMLGDLAFSVPINLPGHESPVDGPVTKVFTSGGKMHLERDGVPIEARNRTISAILVLQHFPAGQELFAAHVRALEEKRGKPFEIEEVMDEKETAAGSPHDPAIRHLRVVVHENPYAYVPLPDELFTGSWDERYGGLDGRIQRLFQGHEVARFAGAT